MVSLSFSQIFVFSVISLVLISNVDASEPYELVNKVCSKQDKVDFCLEILKSDGRSKFANDVLTLTRIAVDVSIQKSTKTRDYFKSVKSGPPGVLKSLNDCIGSYDTAIKMLRLCMLEEDCSLINYDIHSGGDEVRRCQVAADSNGARESFITSSNNMTQDLCRLSESLANLSCNDQHKF